MATNNLLNQPAPGYRRFVNNQVLTDNQLNEVIDHLNYQDKLSRLLLHGVGIVCGLKVSLNPSANTLELSEGAAVTTAGNLLKWDTTLFRGFKNFDDANVKYPFFIEDETETIGLWALETDTSPSDVRALSQFKTRTNISLEDAAALLYLEDFLDEEKDCSAVDCDTQGQQVIKKLRVLLVSKEDAREIANRDSIFSGFLKKDFDTSGQGLSRHFARRIMLQENNTRTLQQFKEAYEISFQSIIEKIEHLSNISIFQDTLDAAGVNPVTELQNLSTSVFNVQYHYGFYRDLSDAYNELRTLLNKNIGLCNPDPDAFPKHILLGELGSLEPVLRHRFYPSPTHARQMIGNIKASFDRILQMIKHFSAGIKNEIKVTPSKNDSHKVGERAIPFYFNLEHSDQPAGFVTKWNDGNEELIPNYYGISYPDEDFNPLDVHLQGHDFYRIEGHIGSHVSDAHKKLQKIRNEKNLPFHIKPIAIGEFPESGIIDFEKYRVYFEDLQVVLEAWNEEQKCIFRAASNFLTGFSSKDPGVHTAYRTGETTGTINVNRPEDDMVNVAYDPGYVPVYYAYHAYTHQPQEPTTHKMHYTSAKENEVLKSISSAEDSFGATFYGNILTNYSRNDIFVNIMESAPDIIQNWNNDLVEATVTIPSQIIGHLKEAEDHKLTDIEEFSNEKLNVYLQSLQLLCRRVRSSNIRLQHMINQEQSELRSKVWLKDYLSILNRIISSCCMMEKIKVLYETILDRKIHLFKRLTLQQFINDHPGAEHKAGVEKGGTFILLYASRNRVPARARDVAVEGTITARARALMHMERAVEHPFSGLEELMTGRRGESIFREAAEMHDAPMTRVSIGQAVRTTGFENIPHGTVIGDLCLPYVCCSDSPPTTFVFPEQLATLRLPVDHICVEEDGGNNPIPLTVMPAGGTVRAFIQNRELTNVILSNENGIFFDPNNVTSNDYGRTIRFEVNGQSVDPVLHVVQKPAARFTVSDDIEFAKRNTVAIITIQNQSSPFNELRFEWRINGQVIDNDHVTEFTQEVFVEPGQSRPVEISLRAFNDYCEDRHSETITIEAPAVDEPVDPNQPTETVNVVLVNAGNNQIQVIKIVREFTGLGLAQTRNLVQSAPVVIGENVPIADARRLMNNLQQVGAQVRLQ